MFNLEEVKDVIQGVALAVAFVEVQNQPGVSADVKAVQSSAKLQAATDLVIKGINDAGITLSPVFESILKSGLPMVIGAIVAFANSQGFFKPSSAK